MKRYIALLRGINVGGKNKLSMKELKALLEQAGFRDVVTYINSGNIIFSSEHADAGAIRRGVEELILKSFGLELAAMVMPAEELIETMNNAPGWWGEYEGSKHNAIFVIPPATAAEVLKEVGELKPQYEQAESFGRVIFWSAPIETFSRTRFSKVVGKPVYNQITIRNSNTAKALAELCR